jgi:hypothetical protein
MKKNRDRIRIQGTIYFEELLSVLRRSTIVGRVTGAEPKPAQYPRVILALYGRPNRDTLIHKISSVTVYCFLFLLFYFSLD